MTCREFVGAVERWLDDALPPRTADAADRHHARCAACSGYVAAYRDTIRLFRAATRGGGYDAHIPEPLVRGILAAAARGDA